MNDTVNHPKHYTNHPSGIEAITITEHMNFCLGNAMKYIWRADMKNGTEDLEKAVWYLNRELSRRKEQTNDSSSLDTRDSDRPSTNISGLLAEQMAQVGSGHFLGHLSGGVLMGGAAVGSKSLSDGSNGTSNPSQCVK